MSAGAEVVVERLRKSFEAGRVRALVEVSFRVEPGEFVGLTGPSGCGKSTLLNLIGALDRPDTGNIVVGGRSLDDIGNAAEYRAATVGFVFQLHDLIPTLTALENVQIPMLGRGSSRHERERRARDLLDEVGLTERTQARPATLSGGERQRVAIARALANAPRLLLADEPTGALDSATGARVLDLLEDVNARHGMTLLVATNDAEVARRSDRALHMRDGVIRGEALESASA